MPFLFLCVFMSCLLVGWLVGWLVSGGSNPAGGGLPLRFDKLAGGCIADGVEFASISSCCDGFLCAPVISSTPWRSVGIRENEQDVLSFRLGNEGFEGLADSRCFSRVHVLVWLVGWCAVRGDGLTMARTAGVSSTILRLAAFFSPALILKGIFFHEKRKTENPGHPAFLKNIFFLTRFSGTVQSERSEGQ
jgi:hypothetical protein